jgi:hypothetical protein
MSKLGQIKSDEQTHLARIRERRDLPIAVSVAECIPATRHLRSAIRSRSTTGYFRLVLASERIAPPNRSVS